jgi:hypothetical protein
MSIDTREGRADSGAPVFLAWGLPAVEAHEGFFGGAALWLSGGASLLLWTALALLLTGY